MTTFNINNTLSFVSNIDGLSGVSFNNFGLKLSSLNRIEKLVGVFISNVIHLEYNFLRWNNIVASGSGNTRTYFRSASSLVELMNSDWVGSNINSFDISKQNGSYAQLMIVLIESDLVSSFVSGVDIGFVSFQDSSKFYTSTFDLGFVPKNILLTYNGNVSDDSIVRFAITGEETTDIGKYQYIESNKINALDDISIVSNKFKLMIEMIGNSGIPIVLHEFALMIGGNAVERLNKLDFQFSSSSESSSSSSYSSSSSSSSSSSEQYSESSESSSSSSTSSSSSSSTSSSSFSSESSLSSFGYSSSSESSESSESSSSESSSSSFGYSSSSESSSSESSSSESSQSVELVVWENNEAWITENSEIVIIV